VHEEWRGVETVMFVLAVRAHGAWSRSSGFFKNDRPQYTVSVRQCAPLSLQIQT
jgi:hypothetical protein